MWAIILMTFSGATSLNGIVSIGDSEIEHLMSPSITSVWIDEARILAFEFNTPHSPVFVSISTDDADDVKRFGNLLARRKDRSYYSSLRWCIHDNSVFCSVLSKTGYSRTPDCHLDEYPLRRINPGGPGTWIWGTQEELDRSLAEGKLQPTAFYCSLEPILYFHPEYFLLKKLTPTEQVGFGMERRECPSEPIRYYDIRSQREGIDLYFWMNDAIHRYFLAFEDKQWSYVESIPVSFKGPFRMLSDSEVLVKQDGMWRWVNLNAPDNAPAFILAAEIPNEPITVIEDKTKPANEQVIGFALGSTIYDRQGKIVVDRLVQSNEPEQRLRQIADFVIALREKSE